MDDELIEKIIEYKRQGITPFKISQLLRIKRKDVVEILRKLDEKGVNLEVIKRQQEKERLEKLDHEIIRLQKEGYKNYEIADILGVSLSTITKHVGAMRKQGIVVDKTEKKIRLDSIDYEILKLLEQGLSMSEIAKTCNTNVSSISNRVKKMRENGVEIQDDREFEETIYDLKRQGFRYKEIVERLDNKISKKKVIYRYNKAKESKQELAKAILQLMKTKHATLEQIQIIADYYGVDLEKTMDSLEER